MTGVQTCALPISRFFKTRSLASDAVKGGRVQLNGVRVKASKEVAVEDEVEVTIGQTRHVVIVRGVRFSS